MPPEMPQNTTGWFDLPYEMRQMVIEKMDNETKLVFFTSSPEFLMCIPRNYIKMIKVAANQIWIYDSDYSYFILDFFSFCGASEVCCIRNGVKTWKNIEKCSLKTSISMYFQNVIRNTRNLKRMTIYSWDFPFETTSIRHLERIENLTIRQEFPIDLIECGFLDVENLYNVCCFLVLEGVSFSSSELHRLRATYILIKLKTFSSKEANKFFKLMSEEGIEKNMISMSLNWTKGFELDFDEITKGLPMSTSDAHPLTFVLLGINNSKTGSISVKSDLLELTILPIEGRDYSNHHAD